MSEKTDLVAIVGSRICHDLVSPLGAIGNGLELMMLSGAEETPEMALVNESIAGANARIRFFRLAFGAASDSAMVRTNDIGEALAAIASPKLGIDWQITGDLPRRDVKLAMLAVNCVDSAMAYGGVITVSMADGGWKVLGKADRLRVDEADWAVLDSGEMPEGIAPNRVHFPLLVEEAIRQDRAVSHTLSEAEITVSF